MDEPFDISKFRFAPVGHVTAIGLRYMAHGDDWVEAALDYDPRLVMDITTNALASGVIISLIDSVCSLSIMARNKAFRPTATLDLRVDYMRAARVGSTVVARGRCYRLTRSIAFVSCEAHDGDPGDLVAHASGAFMFTSAA